MSTFRLIALALICCAAAFHSSGATLTDKLRIISCDLGKLPVVSADGGLSPQGKDLQELLARADADLICLQGALDWETCSRVADLSGDFRVLICSDFPAVDSKKPAGQVAILARERAVLSWAEQVQEENGFAFAIIEVGDRKMGVFSVQAGDSPQTAERIAAEVKNLGQFAQNRPSAFLVAGAKPSSVLIGSGFQTVGKTSDKRPGFMALNAGFLSRPRLLTVQGLPSPVSVADITTADPAATRFAYGTPLLFSGESMATIAQESFGEDGANGGSPFRLWPVLVGGAILILAFVWIARKKNALSRLKVTPSQSLERIDAGTRLDDPVRLGLLAWLKSQFVQRLLAQRTQLLSAETEATRRTIVIEERLSQLQGTLQARISAYEIRIQRLENELSAATIENRDLIRGQIELLREKLAKEKGEQTIRRN